MRISKKHDVRLNEILDAAQLLFTQKGYENATVNDILEKVEIGKGTFYHYFKSKEEVMESVINRMVDFITAAAKTAAEAPGQNAHERLKQVIRAVSISEIPDKEMIQELHAHSNARMHQESIIRTIQGVAPIMGAVVKQGVDEGIYHVEYPRETIEFLLVANQFIFDDGIMAWTPKERNTRVIAFMRMAERALGASQGSFDFLLEISHIGENGRMWKKEGKGDAYEK